jgi:hypothetical protein
LPDLDEDGLDFSHLLQPHFVRAAQVGRCLAGVFNSHVEGKRHDLELPEDGNLNLHVDDVPIGTRRVVVMDVLPCA